MRSRRLARVLFVTIATCLVASPASAKVRRDLTGMEIGALDQSMAQSGPEFKALYNALDQFGMLVGGRGVGYVSNSFYLGGAGYGGTLTRGGLTQNALGYGGLVAGFDNRLLPGWSYDVNLLVGAAAAGNNETDARASLVLEPRISLSNHFGGGVRTALSTGYLYAPNALWLSGPTVGLRVEFKTLTLQAPVDD